MRLSTTVLSLAVVLAVTSAAAPESKAAQSSATPDSKWEWTIAPYIWTAGISLDVEANGNLVLGGDATFPDILDKLDVAGMLHFEARHGKAGLLVDGLYLSLSDESTSSGNAPIPNGTMADTNLKMGIYELGGFFRPGGGKGGFDFLFGARDIDVSQNTDVLFPGPLGLTTSFDGSKNYLDAFAGARVSLPIGKRFNFIARGDVAGAAPTSPGTASRPSASASTRPASTRCRRDIATCTSSSGRRPTAAPTSPAPSLFRGRSWVSFSASRTDTCSGLSGRAATADRAPRAPRPHSARPRPPT